MKIGVIISPWGTNPEAENRVEGLAVYARTLPSVAAVDSGYYGPTDTDLARFKDWIKEHDVKAGVSLNPSTPVWCLEDILPDIDMALLMSVNPGFGGQDFIPQAFEKIRHLKTSIQEKGLSALIEVDGGVKLKNASDVIHAGADILVMGSAFYHSQDYGSFIKQFREIARDS
jgi:ribulose-phosphate 3-epimerase